MGLENRGVLLAQFVQGLFLQRRERRPRLPDRLVEACEFRVRILDGNSGHAQRGYVEHPRRAD